uniref:Uncharacterized protein n=1 Tax=Electrophorus electricus TaxID=8005 RepID=A0A4W4GX54_ELEEL
MLAIMVEVYCDLFGDSTACTCTDLCRSLTPRESSNCAEFLPLSEEPQQCYFLPNKDFIGFTSLDFMTSFICSAGAQDVSSCIDSQNVSL